MLSLMIRLIHFLIFQSQVVLSLRLHFKKISVYIYLFIKVMLKKERNLFCDLDQSYSAQIAK